MLITKEGMGLKYEYVSKDNSQLLLRDS